MKGKLLLLLLLLLAPHILMANSWDKYRHDSQRTGYVPGVGDMPSEITQMPKTKWTTSSPTGSGFVSAPLIGDWGTYTAVIVLDSDTIPVVLNGSDGTVKDRLIAAGINSFTGAHPSLGDYDGDGRYDVYAASYKKGYVFDHDGGLSWQSSNLEASINSAPLVDDLDGDGRDEMVLVTSNSIAYRFDPPTAGETWRVNLTQLAETLAVPSSDLPLTFKSPVAGASYGGNYYLIFLSYNGYVIALDEGGTYLWHKKFGSGTTTISPLVVPSLNLLVVANSAGDVAVLRLSDGTTLDEKGLSTSGIGSNIGYVEVSGRPMAVLGGMDGRVFKFYLDDFTYTSISTNGTFSSGPVIADFDDDGHPEAVFGCSDGRLMAVDLVSNDVDWYVDLGSTTPLPAAGDVDGDSKLELVVKVDGKVKALEDSVFRPTESGPGKGLSVIILSPSEGQHLNQSNVTISYKVYYTGSELVNVRVRIGDGKSFKLLKHAIESANVIRSTVWDASGADDGPYVVSVLASLETSESTEKVEERITFYIDRKPPNLEILSPKPGEEVPIGSPINLTVNATDDVSEVCKMTVKVKGYKGDWKPLVNEMEVRGLTSLNISTREFFIGQRVYIRVWLYDLAGNTVKNETNVTIVSRPEETAGNVTGNETSKKIMAFSLPNPELIVYSPRPGEGADDYFDIRVKIRNNAFEPPNLSIFYTRIEKENWKTILNVTTNWYDTVEYKWDVSALSPGFYKLKFMLQGSGGKTANKIVKVVVKPGQAKVDQGPPILEIVTPHNGSYYSKEVLVSWNATDDVDTNLTFRIFLRLSNGTVVNLGELEGVDKYALNTKGLPEGLHFVTVEAEDDAGNTANRSASFFIDKTPPKAQLRVKPQTAKLGETVTLDATKSTDDKGLAYALWDVDGDGKYDANTTELKYSFKPDKPGKFQAVVEVFDLAGNSDKAAIKYTVVKQTATSKPIPIPTTRPSGGVQTPSAQGVPINVVMGAVLLLIIAVITGHLLYSYRNKIRAIAARGAS